MKKEIFLRDKFSKIVLTDEYFRDYVIRVISKILNIEEEFLKDNLVLLGERINVNEQEIKSSEVDSIYETDDLYINIEINMNETEKTNRKNFRYICHTYLKQFLKGKEEKYRKVVQINIDNYDYYGKNEFIYKSVLMEEKIHEKYNDFIEIYDINLAKLKLLEYNEVKEKEDSSLEKLLYIFICESEEEREKLYKGDKLMKEVNEKLEELSENFDALLYYDKEEYDKEVMNEYGYKKGKEEGKKDKTIEIAKTMLEENMDINLIIKCTGLSEKEINTLK